MTKAAAHPVEIEGLWAGSGEASVLENITLSVRAAEIFGDRFASEGYRRELAAVVAERALAAARERSTA